MAEASVSADPPARSRILPFAIGIGGGALGILPWVVGGGALPLQNLWAAATLPEAMPFVLLPLSQYLAMLLFSLVLLGGVFAGVGVHVVARRRAIAVWPAAVGVALVHLIAMVQSFGVLAGGLGLGGDRRSMLYFAGMLGGAIAAALLAQLSLWMTSRRSVGVAALGVALAAVPFGSWVGRWFVAFTGEVAPPLFLPELLRWVPSIVVGAALVWCGIRPARRIAVWVVGLLALWILPALFTAIQYGLGMRVLDGDVAEMARVSVGLFPMVLAEVWLPVVVALAIAVVGTVVRWAVEKDRAGEAALEPA